ncbi:MAG: hypothetical protein EOM68_21130 [Spirochaetia bacterium]|nr:hypothetical protein [Spirochaetia bacterium]
MTYTIKLASGWYTDSLLEFWPAHVLDLMEASQVDKRLGIDCATCPLACHCHVLEPLEKYRYRKLCTVLFHDLVKPNWALEEVL